MRFVTCSMLALSCLAALAPAFAHPGGLNAEGCHNNRKTGEYHCHRGSAPISIGRGQSFVGGGGGAAFPNCAAARAAGAAPIMAGQPGYGRHIDRDGDGIACEPYRGR